ncbi:hypothetical protein [Absidia glauca]|uniref:ATP-dependent helicase C-terminal domain-containing protein n=1 Tax=Absidia glauca TaxID=4829 RepID=A0A163KHR7_ABSGL|nr:hypothetical protein [Absidia glauca]
MELINYLMAWMYHGSHTFDIQEDSRGLCVWPPGNEIKSILKTHFEIDGPNLARTLMIVFGIACDHAEQQKSQKRDEEHDLRTHLSVASLNMFEKLFLVLGCMNPGVIFQDIAQKAHSVILTSGTLTPVNTFEAELGIQFLITLEANHVIKPSQVMVRNIPYGPSGRPLKGVYANTSTVHYQDDIGEAVDRICEAVPYGVLVFFTSYSLLERTYKRWRQLDQEHQQQLDQERQQQLDQEHQQQLDQEHQQKLDQEQQQLDQEQQQLDQEQQQLDQEQQQLDQEQQQLDQEQQQLDQEQQQLNQEHQLQLDQEHQLQLDQSHQEQQVQSPQQPQLSQIEQPPPQLDQEQQAQSHRQPQSSQIEQPPPPQLDQEHQQQLDQSHQQLDQEQHPQSHQQPQPNQIEQPHLDQNPQQSQYVVSCKRCPNSRLLKAPFEPFALRSRSTFSHYFYTITQSNEPDTPITILEMPSPVAATTIIHTDLHWDSVDKTVYKPFVSPCCHQTLGAHILTTTLGQSSSAHIGKLWLIKARVDVVLL